MGMQGSRSAPDAHRRAHDTGGGIINEWRDAVREVAREASLKDDSRLLGWEASDPRVPPFRYRWEHVRQVVRNGVWLLSKIPAADEEVVLAACWLHDVRKGEPHHARRGADFAREFLPGTTFPPSKIEKVAEAIALHEGLYRPAPDWSEESGEPFRTAPSLQPLEAAILWDADKLSKVGPLSLLHYIPYLLSGLLREGRSITTEGLVEGNRAWRETIAPRIVASFNTLPARQKAQRLHSASEAFWLAADEALGLDR